MYTKRVPHFLIDLEDDEYNRWAEVIARDRGLVKRLAEEAEEDYAFMPGFFKRFLGWLLFTLYTIYGGRYRGELRAWANALGRPLGDVILLNCSYELSHVIDVGAFGCTTGVLRTSKFGLVHARSMDWPLRNIGRATRLFEYRKGERSFFAVGISGFVGVLSGMLPGAYSATLNWAPPTGRPTFDFGPAFLLREVFETCDTYEEAVHVLTHTPLSVPAFFTVCGVEKACVLERTHTDASMRRLRGSVLVQANHHVVRRFQDRNTDKELLEHSTERAETLERALKQSSADSLEEIGCALDVGLVCNNDSYQQMVFCPATGEIKVWRWV